MTQNLIELLNKIVGERIRERREQLGVTQGHLAEAISISRASISNIEQGRQQSPLGILYSIAKALNTDITELLPSHSALENTANKEHDRAREILDRHDVSEAFKRTISNLLNRTES